MGGLMSYGAIATKIRAMESRLLDEEDYRRLASMENISQALTYLKRIPAYENLFRNQSETHIQQVDLERLLVGTLFHDFTKIYRFCDKRQKKFLDLYFARYEVRILKRSLRRIFNHGDRTGEVREQRSLVQKFSDIHMEELAQAETIPQFLEALRGTGYKKALSGLLQVDRATLFDYEMTLDLYYFSEMWKQKDKFLKGKDLELLTRSFGSQIDLLNMMWIYRAKKYYQLPNASIFALVIPISYRLRDSEIRDMVMAEGQHELDQVVQHTYYRKKFLNMTGDDLEKFYSRFLKKIYMEERRKNPYSIAAVTAYLYDKEEELDKLTTVLEGVRYKLPPQETLAYVGQ
ncbi:MAG: V-type ATPase subunit [Lachnospiraceae bacterium]|jgi:V/A-type H+-transporting ATPase subunit C|nr:V-type ATPase subunit [Lachnospiraceae bacterium]